MAGIHGSKSKYADIEVASTGLAEHYNELLHNPRSFEPRTEWHSPLAAMAHGVSGGAYVVDTRAGEDQFWRPSRDKRLGYDDPAKGIVSSFVTYVPPKHHPLCRVRMFACGCGA